MSFQKTSDRERTGGSAPASDYSSKRTTVRTLRCKRRRGHPITMVTATALTFDVVSPEGAYVGGIIAPGPDIAAEALFAHASRLYRVDLRQPPRLIGNSTANAMQSGLFHGYVGLVDGILERLIDEIDGLEAIVATGGRAALMGDASRYIRETHPYLTLLGLKLIYDRNR